MRQRSKWWIGLLGLLYFCPFCVSGQSDSLLVKHLSVRAEAAFDRADYQGALDTLVLASGIARDIGDWTTYADLVSESLTGYDFLKMHRQGWEFFQQVDTAAILQHTGDPQYLGNILLNGGALAMGMSDPPIEIAEGLFQRSLGYYRTAASDSAVADQNAYLANVFQQLSMLEVARKRPDRALAYAWKNYHLLDDLPGQIVRRADALHDLGHYFPMVGKYDSAVWALRAASEVYAEKLDPLHIELIKSRKNVALGYVNLRRFGEARKWFECSLKGHQERAEPDTAAIIFLLHLLAKTSEAHGDRAAMQEYDQQGLALAQLIRSQREWLYAYSLREVALRLTVSDSAQALDYLQASLVAVQQTTDPQKDLERGIYNSLAFLHRVREEHEKARYYFLKEVDLQEALITDSVGLSGLYINIAGTYMREHKYADSRHWLDKAQPLLTQPNHAYQIEIWGGKASLWGVAGQIDSCLIYTQRALAASIGDPTLDVADPWANPSADVPLSNTLMNRLNQKAASLVSLYRQYPEREDLLLAAWETYQHLLSLNQRKAQHLLFAREDAASMLTVAEFYEGMLACAVLCQALRPDPVYLEGIWAVMEARKARRLQAEQHLSALLEEGEAAADWRRTLSELDNQLIFWEAKRARLGVRGGQEQPEWPYIQSQIFDLQRARRALLGAQRQAAPPELPADLATLQQALGPDEYLLSYFWGDSSLVGLGVSAQKVRFQRWAIGPETRDSLTALRKAFSQGLQPDQAGTAWLFRDWIQPLLPPDYMPRRLLVIPDGPLHHIPFEALQVEGRPLIRYSAVRYLYAGHLRRVAPALGARTAVLSMGPSYPGETLAYSRGITRKSWADFGPLRYNREEARAVAVAWEGVVRLGENATEAEFRRLSTAADILHLAMHAYVDAENPQYSALVFAPPQVADSSLTNEGFLYGYEIPHLGISPDLVVLSACETAQGPIFQGEGVMSLARAFALAGCARTLTTRWQVDDGATQEIMTAFHGYLRAGVASDLALRQAQLDYLDQYPTAPVRFWAPFMLVDHSYAASPPIWWRATAALGILLFLLGGLWAMRRRRRASEPG